MIDENSIFVSEHASSSSAFEIEYISSNSGKVYSAEKNSTASPSLNIKEIKDFKFTEVKNVSIPLTNEKWSLLDFLNYGEKFVLVNTYLSGNSVGVNVTLLNANFELESSFSSDGHFSQLFTESNVQKLIKSTIYNDKLYLLTQNSNANQVFYSQYVGFK